MRSVLLLVLAASACGGSPELQLCGQIPEDGCPIGRGGTCDDKTCAALYDCKEGAWTRVVTCPGGPGSGGAGGAGGGGGNGGAGGTCTPFAVDHTGEAAGCKPDLQVPDCPVAVAETCEELACTTRCADFYLCKSDGWAPVAHCDPEGHIVPR